MEIMEFSCDNETGETVAYRINSETGEPSLCPEQSRRDIPIMISSNNKNKRIKTTRKAKKQIHFPKSYNTKTKQFQSLKENIIAGSNTISYRMLLIPTVLIFPGIVCIILMVLEIYLHVRCHKKNKTLKNAETYYRSPFHVVTSIFCGACRESSTASKVGQMQDKRRYHYYYLRGLAI